MMATQEFVGIQDEDGRLVWVSECCSQVDGAFDGPCLWPDLRAATRDNEDAGGLAAGYKYVKVTVIVEDLK